MKRGDLVTVVMPGAFGKPRPAVVVQADHFNRLGSVTFLPLTSDILPDQLFRIEVAPTPDNGLLAPSHVMADKCSTLRNGKVGPVFGTLDNAAMERVDRALATFLGLA
jgi:mRNA interferase MazF